MEKKSSKRSYRKHHVDRDPATQLFMIEKGVPVAGKFIRNTRITEATANELNISSEQSGFMWIEAKEPKLDSGEKDSLWKEIDELVLSGKIEKAPHQATGVKKLKELIAKTKEQ